MKMLPLMVLIAACCATGTSLAAEPVPAKPAPAAAAKDSAAKAAESTPPKSDEDPKVKDPKANDTGEDEAQAAAKPKPSAADKASDKASPQRFVPSEQVRADFDVSFPIDI
ncbi:MAG: hypothetical protein ABW171_11215 [Steroidobacter sp.]